jgi:hypothetical protein
MKELTDLLDEESKQLAMEIGAIIMVSDCFEEVEPILIKGLATITGRPASELQDDFVKHLLMSDDLTENEKTDLLKKMGEI